MVIFSRYNKDISVFIHNYSIALSVIRLKQFPSQLIIPSTKCQKIFPFTALCPQGPSLVSAFPITLQAWGSSL